MEENKKELKTLNEKYLEEIMLIRTTKMRISQFKFMPLKEKAVFLKALESYEDGLKIDIQKNNRNILIMLDDGINPNNKEVIVPADINSKDYEELRAVSLILSTKTSEKIKNLDNVYRSISSYITAFNIPHQEEVVILKVLKNYAEELNLELERKKNLATLNSDLYQLDTSDEYEPLSQKQMFDEIYNTMKKNTEVEKNSQK